MNFLKSLKPEVKAILFVLTTICGGYGIGYVLSMINPNIVIWVCIASLVYMMYYVAVGYFRFKDSTKE